MKSRFLFLVLIAVFFGHGELQAAESRLHCIEKARELALRVAQGEDQKPILFKEVALASADPFVFAYKVVLKQFSDGEWVGCQALEIKTRYIGRSLVCDFDSIINLGRSEPSACSSF